MTEETNFIAKVRNSGSNSMEMTIPRNVVECLNIKEGDFISASIIKRETKEE